MKRKKLPLFYKIYYSSLGVFAIILIIVVCRLYSGLSRYQQEYERETLLNAQTASPSPTPSPTPTPIPTLSPVPTLSPEEIEVLDARVRVIASDVAAFIANKKEYENIQHHFIKDTETEETFRTFENDWYGWLDWYELKEWQITDWSRGAEDEVTCRVRFTLYGYRSGKLSKTDHGDYLITLRETDGVWLVYSLILQGE